MKTVRKDWDSDMNDLLAWAVEHLPDGFKVVLSVGSDEASFGLYKGGTYFNVDYPDDGDHIDFWVEHVNAARRKRGMDEVSFD